MQFVKLSTGYYLDVAVAVGDDAQEVMFTRGLAYSGGAKTKGIIPDAVLPSLMRRPTPQRCRKVAQALVRANLWERVDGGYRIRSWDHWQDRLDALEDRRRKDRERKAAARRGPPDVRGQSADVPADVHPPEIEEEGDAAAAAPDVRGHDERVTELPPPLLDLKDRLHQAGLVVRWDKLTAGQVTQILDLLATHTAARLVKSAQSQWQKDNPPAWAQAWIAGWSQIPQAVARRREKCPEHEVELPCISCAADRKAAVS